MQTYFSQHIGFHLLKSSFTLAKMLIYKKQKNSKKYRFYSL
ncbi:hypothetical protein K661_00796 [Piscirickettsia salmonis LF-89 = ATCC VR-1361]|nr:hypothetical protein K661_00796 [Piscirickettsia salmonis LF-89 = ATCC VR-1361]